MKLLKEPQFSNAVKCPYIDGKEFIQEYFYAYDLNEKELDEFLSSGWRRFGLFFFKPDCRRCQKCVPLRIPCSGFKPSKSQRRILRKNEHTEVRLSRLGYSDEIFEIYRKHSKIKFGQESDLSHFKESFFMAAVPCAQSEYYIDGKLMAVGFLDISLNAFSSVYFIYDPDYGEYSPGNFSILKEIEIAEKLGISYYNLGYWIKENKSMAYKGKFRPFQTYHWDDKVWINGDCYKSDNPENIADKKEIET